MVVAITLTSTVCLQRQKEGSSTLRSEACLLYAEQPRLIFVACCSALRGMNDYGRQQQPKTGGLRSTQGRTEAATTGLIVDCSTLLKNGVEDRHPQFVPRRAPTSPDRARLVALPRSYIADLPVLPRGVVLRGALVRSLRSVGISGGGIELAGNRRHPCVSGCFQGQDCRPRARPSNSSPAIAVPCLPWKGRRRRRLVGGPSRPGRRSGIALVRRTGRHEDVRGVSRNAVPTRGSRPTAQRLLWLLLRSWAR
jgi:hypothetical protein